MYFSTTVSLAALPFLVSALSVPNSPRDVISIPLSKRSTHDGVPGSVIAASLEENIDRTTTKFQRGFESFKRNTGRSHSFEPKQGKLGKRGVGYVPLAAKESSVNQFWSGKISVGTPPKEFIVEFDTGTSDLIIPGPNCPTCGTRPEYNPGHSSTSKNVLFSELSINGIMKGVKHKDIVEVGGFKASCQTLGAASEYGPTFNSSFFQADGVMGLAFGALSSLNATPVFETLVKQNKALEPVFGLSLSKSNPELILGGTAQDKFTGKLAYSPVIKEAGVVPAFWQISFGDINVNGKSIPHTVKDAVIDSGTSLITGEFKAVASIYKNIPGSGALLGVNKQPTGLYTVPCNTSVPISLDFGGSSFQMDPKTYILGDGPNGTCIGAFSGPETNSTNPFWIIGLPFLENVYVEFDAGNLQVGIAPLA